MFKIFSFFLAFLFYNFSIAQPPIIVSSETELQKIGEQLHILKDEGQKYSPKEAWEAQEYIESKNEVPNLGVTDACYWLKFTVTNKTILETLFLELNYPVLDRVVLYEIDSTGTLIDSIRMGEYLPFDVRKYSSPNYIFDLKIPSGTSKQFMLKLNAGEQILVPLYIGSYEAIFEYQLNRNLFSGIYFGIILVMFLYNLFLYFTVKDRSYLFYVIYIILVGLTQATFKGYSYKYLWPEIPWMAQHSVYILGALVGIATILFVRSFLHTKDNAPKLDKGLFIVLSLDVLGLILALVNFYNLSYNVINITAGIGAIYIFIIALRIYRKGFRPAKYFLTAWTIFLASVIIFVLKDYFLIPYTFFTSYMLEIGSSIEVVLLSLALADRINILKQEKEASQARTLEILRENERIIREQNIILEEKVKERTKELNQSNEELSLTLDNLRETQTQLVNSEKMASLGQLTAGIAHEINNPINFVASNVKPLRMDIEDLLTILKKYDEIGAGEVSNVAEKLQEVEQLKKELDEDYLVEEIDSLLNGIQEGANRTAEIIKGLRNFSRLDEDNLKETNINEGLDSTLVLLRSSFKDEIKIEKEYTDDAEVICYPGKMNQVFMNILSNAVQAIKANPEQHETGMIIIKTISENGHLQISIKDNGPGIPEDIRQRIFDPFFTTKEVGEGTGLGLSIAYSIIENHHGKLQVQSAPGMGTEFIITIPKVRE